ncbi:MAG: transglutaminase-like domain-containing protein [Treponemataceae bacterium]|nr:transglutaminase-like domain-containing protein [Treponemataceae bacterium]
MSWNLLKKIFFILCKLVFLLALVDLPLVFLAWYLKARGPWFLPLLSSFLIVGLSLWTTETQHARLKTILSFFVFLIASLWISIFLILINVSRRSQAELWFDMVHQGQAEGFFSYFAVLLIGVLTHGCGFLYLYTGILSALSALSAIGGLIAAVLFNISFGWVFVGIGIFISLTFSILKKTNNSFSFYSRTLFSLFVPFAPVILIFLGGNFFFHITNPSPISILDFTPLVYRYFPDLPLLLEIPGYGTSINSGQFPPRLILSPLSLYHLQGPPNTELYLATHIYRSFSNEGWIPFYISLSEVPFQLSLDKPSFLPENSFLLELTLTTDFSQVLPLPAELKELYIPSGILRNITEKSRRKNQRSSLGSQEFTQLLMSGGIIFPEPIKKNTEFYVIYTKPTNSHHGIPGGYLFGKPEDFLEPFFDPHGTIRHFVQRWENISDPLGVIQEIVSFLKKNYTYTEETKGGPIFQSIERFLFEEKKGYCLHFASSLIALARERGIPARLVEGYRIKLDEKGSGEIRGTNAHAWAEVFIDGQWFRFDPTPAQNFQEEITPENIVSTKRQTPENIALLGKEQRKIPYYWVVLFIGFLAILSGLILWLYMRKTPLQHLHSKARRLVKKARRYGIPGPERLGWTGWLAAIEQQEIPLPKEEVRDVAWHMITHTFGTPSSHIAGHPLFFRLLKKTLF